MQPDDDSAPAKMPPGLVSLLDAGRRDAPSADELARLRLRLAPAMGSTIGPRSMVSLAGAGAIAAGAVLSVAGVLVVLAMQSGPLREESRRSAPVVEITTRPVEPRVVGPLPEDLSPPPVASARDDRDESADVEPRRGELPAEDVLIDRAQRALASSPRRARALLRRHEVLYPDGALAQEREALMVSLLIRTGERAHAARRVQRFAERWPGSAHLARLRTLVRSDPGAPPE
jgi:hypothetical protein